MCELKQYLRTVAEPVSGPANIAVESARAILLDRHDNVLLLQRPDNAQTNPGMWEVPGGKIDFDETVHDALVREVGEETGLEFTYLDEHIHTEVRPYSGAETNALYVAYFAIARSRSDVVTCLP